MADFFKFRRELEEAKCGKDNKREEKLDPVGKADADIDNDGDVDSSDEYLKKRRKAISKAMKKEDDGPCWDGYVQVGMKMKNGKEVPNCVPVEEAKKMMDEASSKTKKELSKLMTKALDGKRPKPGYTSSIADNGDFVVADGGGRVVGRIKKGDFENPMKEETLSEIREPFAVIDTADKNKVVATASSEKEAKRSIATAELPPMRIKDKNTLEVVKTRKKQDVGFPLKEETLSEGYYDYPDYGPVGASEMAQTQLHFIKYAADDITRCLKMGCPMPEWYQNKLAKMEGDMEGLYSYMKGKTRKMKAHQADRYSMGMRMYGEQTLSESKVNERFDINDFYFVAKKERGKTVYLQYDGSVEVGKVGPRWIKNPEDANGYLNKRDAMKAAKMHGGKVQKGLSEAAKSGDDDAYDEFFQAALKKFGVKGIGELDKEKKKEFFNYVDKNWKGDKEESGQLDEKVNMNDLKDTVKKYNDQNGRSAFHYPKKKMVSVDGRGMNYDDAMEKMKRVLGESYISEKLNPSDDVSKWIEDFYDSDAPQFKGKSKEERREMAVAAWLDARREAGYDVGPNPNEKD